jgi:hypothetical protein
LKLSFLLCITAPHNDQINVASDASIAKLRAAEQVDRLDPKSCRVHGRRNTFCKPLTPAPVFGGGAQALTTKFALFPLQVLAYPMRDVIQ